LFKAIKQGFWKHFAPRKVVLPPYGVEKRGFQGKNAFADQAGLTPDASVIFDVGAHTGETTVQYRAIYPEATIYAFEPYPPSFEKYAAAFADDRRVIPQRYAVADATGPCQLHSYTNSATNSLLPTVEDVYRFVAPGQIDGIGVVEAQSITIADFCRGEGIPRIDILKLDIQGAELKALAGAAALLERRAIGIIYTEVLFVPVYQGQAWYYDIAAFLARYGYRLFDVYNFTYADSGQLRWGDALFVAR
jgi:FkbM family methyltransferase